MDGIKNIDNKFMIERASFKDNTKTASPVEQSGVRKDNPGFFDASNSNLSTQQTESMRRNIKNIAAMAIDPTSDVSDLTEAQIKQELDKSKQDLNSAKTGMEINDIRNKFLGKIERKIYEIGGHLQADYVDFLAAASLKKSTVEGTPIKGGNLATPIDQALISVY